MSTILKTRIALVDESAQDELEDILGKSPRRGQLDESHADIYLNLLDVTAIRQAFDLDGKLEENETHVYFGVDHYAILTPFQEVATLWIRAQEPEKTQEVKEIDLGQAVNTLCKALEHGQSEGEGNSFYYAYQSNIAMAFVDAWANHKFPTADPLFLPKPELVHKIANQAAKNFLDLLISSTK